MLVVVVVGASEVVVVLVVVEVVEGHVNGPQVNAQLIPTAHCAILRASPMLQAPSPLTSHASGCASWPQRRSPTSNWATTSASPMSTTPSPFTSPQGTAATVVARTSWAAITSVGVKRSRDTRKITGRLRRRIQYSPVTRPRPGQRDAVAHLLACRQAQNSVHPLFCTSM